MTSGVKAHSELATMATRARPLFVPWPPSAFYAAVIAALSHRYVISYPNRPRQLNFRASERCSCAHAHAGAPSDKTSGAVPFMAKYGDARGPLPNCASARAAIQHRPAPHPPPNWDQARAPCLPMPPRPIPAMSCLLPF